MLSRNIKIDEIIKQSQLFPRIRDAEIEMKTNEEQFMEHLKLKKDKERRRKQGTLVTHKAAVVQDQYFSVHVLNRDPAASKYLLYDEVFFPKLFNEESRKAAPEGIDNVWMMAFRDMELRRPLKAKATQEKALKKKKQEEQNAFKSRRFNMYES